MARPAVAARLAVVTTHARGAISSLDVGLLVMRIGATAAGALLLAWGGFPHATVPGLTGRPWAVTVVLALMSLTLVGFGTRSTAAVLSVAMAGAAVAGLRGGQDPLQEPARAVMFVVLYAAMALTGPGALSAEGWGESVRTRMGIESPHRRISRTNAGLLVLRLGTGLSLFCFFGLTKIGWVVALVQSPGPWSAWPFAQLIHNAGFPAPVLLALCAVLNETVTPVFVAAGMFARVAAAVGAVGMAGAMYTSLWLAEEPVRAMLYVVAFATLSLAGPGALSLGRKRLPNENSLMNGGVASSASGGGPTA